MNRLTAAIAVLLAAVILYVVFIADDDHGPAPGPVVQTRTLGGGDVVKPTVGAVKQAAASDVGDHQGLKTELPPDVTTAELQDAQDQQDRLAEADNLPVLSPLAAPEQDGCKSTFVRNASSRRGVRPRLFVLHFTVSPNRPGWSDVDAIVSLFDRSSFAASSNYVLDTEGHCAYIVREVDKAWTQATYNPVSISVEVIDTGKESTYLQPPGLSKLAKVISDSTKRWDIPLRRGSVSGCTVTRSGIVDHTQLGSCGGGHCDISGCARFSVQQVIDAAVAYRGRGQVTSVDRVTCRKLLWWRTHGRHHGKAERNAIRRRAALDKRGVTCTSTGPTR